MQVGKRIKIVVHLFESLIDLCFKFVLFVLSKTKMIFELSFIQFTKAKFTFLSTYFFQWAVLLS